MDNELILLWLAVCTYVAAGSLAIIGVVLGKRPERTVPGLASRCLKPIRAAMTRLGTATADSFRAPPLGLSSALQRPGYRNQ